MAPVTADTPIWQAPFGMLIEHKFPGNDSTIHLYATIELFTLASWRWRKQPGPAPAAGLNPPGARAGFHTRNLVVFYFISMSYNYSSVDGPSPPPRLFARRHVRQNCPGKRKNTPLCHSAPQMQSLQFCDYGPARPDYRSVNAVSMERKIGFSRYRVSDFLAVTISALTTIPADRTSLPGMGWASLSSMARTALK